MKRFSLKFRNDIRTLPAAVAAGLLTASLAVAKPIQHDAEHYVLLHQYKDQWAREDKEIDKRLAEIRKASRDIGLMTWSSRVTNAAEARRITGTWAGLLRARLDEVHGKSGD